MQHLDKTARRFRTLAMHVSSDRNMNSTIFLTFTNSDNARNFYYFFLQSFQFLREPIQLRIEVRVILERSLGRKPSFC